MAEEDTQTIKKKEKRKIKWLPIIICVGVVAIAIFILYYSNSGIKYIGV